jgi:Asp-tRNA(Asn)/Glu-tRNA(Gln) amidotransferase A subunit family amidase
MTVLRAIAPSVRRQEPTAAERMRVPSSIRVGFDEQDIEVAAHQGIRGALRTGMAALTETGIRVVPSALAPDHDYWATMDGLMDYEARGTMTALGVPAVLDQLTTEDQRTGMARILALGPERYEAASRARKRLERDLRRQFTTVDVIASYTLLCDASSFPVEQRAMLVSASGGNTALLAAGNIAGLPAVFLPVGLSDRGLPVGIQLVGPRRSDALLIALGERFQASTDWHRLRPPTP